MASQATTVQYRPNKSPTGATQPEASTWFVTVFRPRSPRLDNSPYVMHNECMPLIQVRDVPEDVRDELARKAALAGKSLQSYLLGELTKLSERPSMAEIVARNQARARATGSTVTMSDAVAAVRAERDRHET
jgi:antitoxin FitA